MGVTRSCFRIGICIGALLIAVSAHAEETLFIQVPAVYDKDAPVVSAVRRECGIEALIGNHVFKAVSTLYPKSVATPDPKTGGSDKSLLLTIIAVQGVGGGNWSGAKSITIRADLMQDAKPIVSKVLNRGSHGGFFGGMSGTCPIMERIAVTLGKDTLAWLRSVPAGGSGAQTGSPKPEPTTSQ